MPVPDITWEAPRRAVDRHAEPAFQRELALELGPAHPLWRAGATVIGCSSANDDVVVALDDGRVAVVHLVWHGRVDHSADRYPETRFVPDLEALTVLLAGEAAQLRDDP